MCEIETTSDGASVGSMSTRCPCAPVEDHVLDRRDRAVDRRVDVGAGRGAHVERRGRRALAPGELVPARAAATPRRRSCGRALQQPLVHLAAERLEGECAVATALVADRGHPRLAIGQLEVQRAEARDDLGLRRAGGSELGRARRERRHGCRPPAAECGHEPRQQGDGGNDDEDGETAAAPLLCGRWRCAVRARRGEAEGGIAGTVADARYLFQGRTPAGGAPDAARRAARVVPSITGALDRWTAAVRSSR